MHARCSGRQPAQVNCSLNRTLLASALLSPQAQEDDLQDFRHLDLLFMQAFAPLQKTWLCRQLALQKKKKKKVTYPLTVHGLGWGGPHLVDPKSVIRAMEADRCQDICNPNSASGIGHRADACLLSVTGFQGSSRAGSTVYRDKCDRG